MGEDRPDDGRPTTRRRVTAQEAAELLGVTVEAVRGRIKRGTLKAERTPEGVYVWLETDWPTDRTRPAEDQPTDRSRSDADALISAKDETITALREQLEAERQAHAESRRLLMAALERIPPALEAPRAAPGGPQTAAEEPDRVEHRTDTGGAQEAARRRPWWRRWFGG